MGNWTGAEENPELLAELIANEVSSRWLEEVPDLSAAQLRWGDSLAVGRVSVVHAEGRKSRLMIDSAVCGTNDACTMNESYSLPMLSSMRHAFPLRGSAHNAGSFSIGIEAAHKTVRVREKDRGLLGLHTQLPGQPARYYFYRPSVPLVCQGRSLLRSHASPVALASPHAQHVR